MSDTSSMDGDEFIKRVKKHGKANGIAVRFDRKRGKGSHGTLYFDNKKATVKRSEISKGLLAAMLKQLGIDKDRF